jgi:hypothetical protein
MATFSRASAFYEQLLLSREVIESKLAELSVSLREARCFAAEQVGIVLTPGGIVPDIVRINPVVLEAKKAFDGCFCDLQCINEAITKERRRKSASYLKYIGEPGKGHNILKKDPHKLGLDLIDFLHNSFNENVLPASHRSEVKISYGRTSGVTKVTTISAPNYVWSAAKEEMICARRLGQQ